MECYGFSGSNLAKNGTLNVLRLFYDTQNLIIYIHETTFEDVEYRQVTKISELDY